MSKKPFRQNRAPNLEAGLSDSSSKILDSKTPHPPVCTSEQAFNAILDSIQDTVVLLVNKNMDVIDSWISKEFLESWSGESERQNSFDWFFDVTSLSRNRLFQSIEYVLREGEPLTYQERVLNGSDIIFFEISISAIIKDGNVVSAVCYARDKSREHQALQLSEFRMRFESILMNMSTYFIDLPAQKIVTGIRETLKAISEFVGLDRAFLYEIVSDDTVELKIEWYKQEFGPLQQDLKTIRMSDVPTISSRLINLETLLIHSDEDIDDEMLIGLLKRENTKTMLLIPMTRDSKLIGFLGFESMYEYKRWGPEVVSLFKLATEILSNVLSRYEAQNNLLRSEERFRAVFESTDDRIFVWSKTGHLLYANKAGLAHIAQEKEAVFGEKYLDIFCDRVDTASLWRDRVSQVLKSGKILHIHDHLYEDSKEEWIDSTLTPLLAQDGSVFAVAIISRDITESEKIKNELNVYREKMMRTEQLASLGVLGATVAHELNQPLTVLRLLTQQSLRRLRKMDLKDDVAVENLNDSLSELDNATKIVQRFREFARKMPRDEIVQIDLKKNLDKIVASLMALAKRSGLTVKTQGFSELPPVWANKGELDQIFFVIIQNAIQATVPGKPNTLTISACESNGSVKILFRDSGKGIEKEKLPKIFEPFFTTKSPKNGTGLGLSIVKDLLEGRGGKIEVESELGIGTCFEVNFPVKAD